MRECTGKRDNRRMAISFRVPEDQIEELATNSARCIPCMMPYITAFFHA